MGDGGRQAGCYVLIFPTLWAGTPLYRFPCVGPANPSFRFAKGLVRRAFFTALKDDQHIRNSSGIPVNADLLVLDVKNPPAAQSLAEIRIRSFETSPNSAIQFSANPVLRHGLTK
ncbi:MAG: hypothetical protein JO028_14980 [Acidobacteriaceae bacterium]|nr:hypothetical protein [Acidobacteriaceae bacterium]